jgi:acetoin utilization protein AcuB
VGIITETDLFRAFTDMLGGYREGVRITFKVAGGKGVMARIAQAVTNAGGDIVGMGVDDSGDDSGKTWLIAMKVQCAPKDKLVDALKPLVVEVIDARD